MMITLKNINKPAPRWFLKLKKIISLTTNTVILGLLLYGYEEQSFLLLIIKLGSSYLMQMLDTILGENEKEIIPLVDDNTDDTVFPTKPEPKGPK